MKTKRKSLIDKLDKEFSIYIRNRDAKGGIAECVTCGIQKEVKQLQCGHFMSRKHYSTRWDEVNCQVQCYTCNVMRYGEQYKFGLYLNSNYVSDMAEQLLNKSRETVKLADWELEEMIENYKIKNKKLGL
jgi:hypothetical protein